MPIEDEPFFAFEEPDHLLRIHLKLGLQDIGFDVAEQDNDLVIATGARAEAQPERSNATAASRSNR